MIVKQFAWLFLVFIFLETFVSCEDVIDVDQRLNSSQITNLVKKIIQKEYPYCYIIQYCYDIYFTIYHLAFLDQPSLVGFFSFIGNFHPLRANFSTIIEKTMSDLGPVTLEDLEIDFAENNQVLFEHISYFSGIIRNNLENWPQFFLDIFNMLINDYEMFQYILRVLHFNYKFEHCYALNRFLNDTQMQPILNMTRTNPFQKIFHMDCTYFASIKTDYGDFSPLEMKYMKMLKWTEEDAVNDFTQLTHELPQSYETVSNTLRESFERLSSESSYVPWLLAEKMDESLWLSYFYYKLQASVENSAFRDFFGNLTLRDPEQQDVYNEMIRSAQNTADLLFTRGQKWNSTDFDEIFALAKFSQGFDTCFSFMNRTYNRGKNNYSEEYIATYVNLTCFLFNEYNPNYRLPFSQALSEKDIDELESFVFRAFSPVRSDDPALTTNSLISNLTAQSSTERIIELVHHYIFDKEILNGQKFGHVIKKLRFLLNVIRENLDKIRSEVVITFNEMDEVQLKDTFKNIGSLLSDQITAYLMVRYGRDPPF